MNDVVKLLDENLRYISHVIIEDTLFIRFASEKLSLTCPSCSIASAKVHSRYERTFHDLPIQGKKVVYVINNRKMFCHNAQYHRKTFAEQFLFLPYKAKKSTRLEQEIMKTAQNLTSLVAEKILNRGIAKVGKSTICNLLKKQS
ncbi:transposase family protein [Bacillus toyonensis]|uniref:transposase family protein n=1 Tax=Bacillus toyonensis TaxID=155322 RepID=UPI001C0D46F4|nr:transposase family protein [Bacillus toyonensis]MBU4642340.1 transposase family protein [Bacillus toyonensis]